MELHHHSTDCRSGKKVDRLKMSSLLQAKSFDLKAMPKQSTNSKTKKREGLQIVL